MKYAIRFLLTTLLVNNAYPMLTSSSDTSSFSKVVSQHPRIVFCATTVAVVGALTGIYYWKKRHRVQITPAHLKPIVTALGSETSNKTEIDSLLKNIQDPTEQVNGQTLLEHTYDA